MYYFKRLQENVHSVAIAEAEDDVDASVDVPMTPNTLSPAEMDIIITNARILVLK